MRRIEVCLSPELIHLHQLEGKVIVVLDVLRATSCIVTGLAHKVASITPVASLEKCRSMKQQGYYIAGERDGNKVDGFDLGNSPFSYMEEFLKGQKIAMTTTNGTFAIEKSRSAEDIIIGSFLNIQSVVRFLKNHQNDALLVCSGWRGHISLEDSICAGSIVEDLKDDFQTDGDTSIAAKALIKAANGDLISFLSDSSHVQRLQNLNVKEDIEFCLTPNQYDVLPILDGDQLVSLE